MEYFQKAIQLEPKDVSVMNNLAICYIEEENLKEAERLLEKAIQVNDHFLPARQNLEKLRRSDRNGPHAPASP